MNTKKAGTVLVVLAIAFASMACGLSSIIPSLGGSSGNGSSGAVTSLWPDVPKMDGMTVVQQDMPLEANIMIQGVLAAISGNQGSINYIIFTTNSSVSDVFNYYSSDRMTSAGWKTNEEIGCTTDTLGTPSPTDTSGGLCMYARDTGANTSSLLIIIPSVDDSTKQTDVLFARVDVKDTGTPTPAQ